MKLIPVIDLKSGKVVHAVAGQRDHYAPLTQSRFPLESPQVLCKEIHAEFSPPYFYAADLDAIEGIGHHRDLFQSLLSLETHWLLDAGLQDVDRWRRMEQDLAGHKNWSPVIGSESCRNWKLIETILSVRGSEHVHLSLDLRHEQLLTHPDFKNHDLECYVQRAIELGIRNFITIDLSRVGTGTFGLSPIISKLNTYTAAAPCRILVGGGVKTPAQLAEVCRLGCDGVLVATALHSGTIRASDVPWQGALESRG